MNLAAFCTIQALGRNPCATQILGLDLGSSKREMQRSDVGALCRDDHAAENRELEAFSAQNVNPQLILYRTRVAAGHSSAGGVFAG